MLNWPTEATCKDRDTIEWWHAGSNLCLDFHGNPAQAKLVIFSDGNHHMALEEILQLFYQMNPDVEDIFYVTTPPGPILQLLKSGSLQIGNFILAVKPHVFFSPPAVLDSLVDEGYMKEYVPFMKNRGSVLLIKKENPKNIVGINDLIRSDIKLFLPNPQRESVSFIGYCNTIRSLAARDNLDVSFLADERLRAGVCHGERIHHREAPQAIMDDHADVALVYYHLALRYTRIFPDLFEIIPLGGTAEDPQPLPGNGISESHVGIIHDGGPWGRRFFDFLSSGSVSRIYSEHGMFCVKT